MDSKRYHDNDYVQEQYEQLIGIFQDGKDPYFLLDEDYFVKWANQSAERLYPAFSQPDGILNLLESYPKERLLLENGAFIVDLSLEKGDNRHLTIHRSRSGEIYTIYTADIHTKIDISTLPREEVGKRVSESELHYREPLSEIFIALKQLKMREDVPDMEGCCNQMARSSVQMLRGTNMIAENVRLSQGILEHDLHKVDMTHFLSALFQTATELVYMEAVDIHFATPVSRRIVTAEPEYILSCIGQLLSNAIRYRLPGTPIRVKYSVNQRHIEIEVINRGASLPQEVCEHMFDAYYNYSPDGDFIPESTLGLGLTIAKAYAGFMGGSLTFETVGKNCVFKLSLPLTPLDDDTPLWQMNEYEMKMHLCVLLSDAVDTSDELLAFIG